MKSAGHERSVWRRRSRSYIEVIGPDLSKLLTTIVLGVAQADTIDCDA